MSGRLRELYTQIPHSMLDDDEMTLADLRVYSALDRFAGPRGWWFGEQERIANRAHVSVASVKRSIERLKERGYLGTEQMGLRRGLVLMYLVLSRTRPKPTKEEVEDAQSEDFRSSPMSYESELTHELANSSPVSSTIRSPQTLSPNNAAAARARDPDFARAFRALENLLGLVNPIVVDEMGQRLARGPTAAEWIEAACEEAALSNGRSWNYVAAVLDRWEREGFRSERKRTSGANGRVQEGRVQSRRGSDYREREAMARKRGGEW